MYQHPQHPQQGQHHTPAPVSKKGFGGLAVTAIVLVTGAVTGLGGCAVGVAIGSSGSKTPQRDSLAVGSQSPTRRSFTPIPVPTTPEPVAYTPKPSDFDIKVIEIEHDCYGYGVGCNITYRIDPKYTGLDLDDGTNWTISYKIIGGKQPKTDSFDMTGDGNAQIDDKTMITVPNSSVKLKAKVTQVLAS